MRRRFGGISLTAARVGGLAKAEPPGARQARLPPRTAISAPATLTAQRSATPQSPPSHSDRRERPRRIIGLCPAASGRLRLGGAAGASALGIGGFGGDVLLEAGRRHSRSCRSSALRSLSALPSAWAAAEGEAGAGRSGWLRFERPSARLVSATPAAAAADEGCFFAEASDD